MKPTSLAEWSEAVQASSAFLHAIPPEWGMGETGWVDYGAWRSVIEFSPDDLVVRVQAGITLGELQAVLAESGRMLPMGFTPMSLDDWTLAELISINPPHTWEIERGGWRDWVLGLTLLLGDGRVVKVGSSAVKNVAGYDVQKLIVGSRGTMAVVLEVTLVVSSIVAPPKCATLPGGRWWIQRVPLSDAPRLEGGFVHAESGTLWAHAEQPLPRFEGDWVMQPGPLIPPNAAVGRLWQRAKDQLDPRGVLNPGYLEVAVV